MAKKNTKKYLEVKKFNHLTFFHYTYNLNELDEMSTIYHVSATDSDMVLYYLINNSDSYSIVL